MTERQTPSGLAGVSFGWIAGHGDARGTFRELWRAEAFEDLDPALAGAAVDRASRPVTRDPIRFVQANLSTSAPGVLRGLHLHRRQLDHWVVASGRAFVALVDVRPLIERTGPHPIVETRVLAANATVTIPVGVAHGFLALEALELLYFVTNTYDGTDELGFAWDDSAVAVPWPIVGTPDGRPILSARDDANPSLAELVATLRA